MKLWEKVKNIFFTHKKGKYSSEREENIVSEELQVQAKIRETKLKEPSDIISIETKELSILKKLHNVPQEIRSSTEEVYKLSDQNKTVSEVEDLNIINMVDKLVIIENNMRLDISNEVTRNYGKKSIGIKNFKKPSTHLPNHNVKVDFKRYKEHYQYYLVKGSEYEQIRAIQSIKKAVREEDSNHEEWLDILLYVYLLSTEKIQKYILDTLKSFSLNTEERNRINELNPPEKPVEDIKKSDYKLDKPRIVGSRTVEEKVTELIQSVVNTEEKKPFFEKSKNISVDESINKKEKVSGHQNTLSLQDNLPKKVNQLKLSEKEYIKEECLKRNITSIYHFTNARNVKKILQYGILSVDELRKKNIDFESNDNERRDGMENSTCWSVSFPNNKYFYRVRERHPEMKWCVIEADASLLFDLDCYFYETNAASNAVRMQSTSRKGHASFMKMFVRRSFEDEILPSKYPTDVQAEVMITETIKPSRIKAIHTKDVKVFDYYYNNYPHLVKSTPSLFRIRQ